MDTIVQMKVNYQNHALGISVDDAIRFSWQYQSDRCNRKQKSYEIRVFCDPHGTKGIWSSGKVSSARMTAIPYTGPQLSRETRYYWGVLCETDEGATVQSPLCSFVTDADLSGNDWIVPVQDSQRAPRLRLQTYLDQQAVFAVLYMTALGCYSAYVNGQKISASGEEELLCPGWTDYRYYTNYQTYDVTQHIRKGSLTLAAELGKGWYAGRIGDAGRYEGLLAGFDGRPLALLAKLVVYGTDGRKLVFGMKADEWLAFDESPVLTNDLYDGETFDAGMDIRSSGWNKPDYSICDWSVPHASSYKGKLRSSNRAIVRVAEEYTRKPIAAYQYSDSDIIAPPKSSCPFGEVTKWPVNLATIVTLKAGSRLIVDFGQNAAGVLKLCASGPLGTYVSIRHAEMLNDGRKNGENSNGGSDGPKGTLYMKAIKNAKATDTLVLSGNDADVYMPQYTYHGFRYAEITASAEITIFSVVAKTITSIDGHSSSLNTNDKNINQLFRNVRWSQLSNYLSIPTDCPQRGERVGWTGDAQIFAKTAIMNFDCIAFLENYVDIMQEHAARNDNVYGAIIPPAFVQKFSETLSSGWGDAGIIIPWVLYRNTGDPRVLEKSFAQMEAYLEAVESLGYHPDLFGDWLSFQGASTPYMNAVYRIYTTQLMHEIADALGRPGDAGKYAKQYDVLKSRFLKKYLDAHGNVLSATADGVNASYHGYPLADNAQTAILWALKCGLHPDMATRDKMILHLADNIKNIGGEYRHGSPENSLSVGFLGVNILLPILSEVGMDEIAYDLLLQNQMPSWLYSVDNGATTIWERWNSYSNDNSFGDASMNSFNHYSYGACAEWIYEYVAGIRLEWDKGIPKITVAPRPDPKGRISHVDLVYPTVVGDIHVVWEYADGEFRTLEVAFPPNVEGVIQSR